MYKITIALMQGRRLRTIFAPRWETKDISMDLAADQGPQVDESGRALTAEQKRHRKGE